MKSPIVPIVVTTGILSIGVFVLLYLRRKSKANQKSEIHSAPTKEVESTPTVITEELEVPATSCGKIEGYSGSVLLDICTKSSAKVWVDPSSRKPYSETRKVLITGTSDQVALAKQLINEKINESQSSTDLVDSSSPKDSMENSTSQSKTANEEQQREVFLPAFEKLVEDEFVFVSAARSPSQFYLQRAGGASTELDYLVDTMTEYYSSKKNQGLHKIEEPSLGQVCAAMLLTDNKWYRAEIVEIQKNGTLPNENSIVYEVFFLDFGDRQFVTKNNIFELHGEFLSLRFQAIESFLAHVKPQSTDVSNEWESKAIEKFEELVQPSHWKKLKVKVVTYRERKELSSNNSELKIGYAPIPGVDLYEDAYDGGRNVAAEMVKTGHAKINGEQFGDLRKSSILALNKQDDEKIVEEKQLDDVQPDVKPDVSIEFVINNPDDELEKLTQKSNDESNVGESVTSEIEELDDLPSNSLEIDPDESDDDDNTESARFTVSLPVLQRNISKKKNGSSSSLISHEKSDTEESFRVSTRSLNSMNEDTEIPDKMNSISNSAKKQETSSTKPAKMRDWNEMLEDD